MPTDSGENPDDPDEIAADLVPAGTEIEPADVLPPVVEHGLARISDPVARFLAEARKYRRLSESEERELAAARNRGEASAARTLVIHNLRLVISIAYQYRRAWLNILDLFQEGSLGLVEAVKRWEPTLGARFGSYAAFWIRAYILRFLLTNSRLIHVGNTRAGRKLFFRLEQERQRLMAAGCDPTPKLLAAKLNVNEADLEEVSQHLASHEVSLSPRPAADDDMPPLEERLASGAVSPEDQAAHNELSSTLATLVKQFGDSLTDERERAIWSHHLSSEDPEPLSTLGQKFGVSKQRMGQIADRLKTRFRAELLEKMGADIKMAWLGED